MTFGTREVAREPSRILEQVSGILSLRVALTLASFILLCAVTFLIPLDARLRVLIVLSGFRCSRQLL